MTGRRDLARLRLAAQRLLPPALDSPTAAVGHLLAVQAQDARAATTAVALRTTARSADAVRAAFDAGSIVKSWPMRGTLHLTRAADLPWLLELLGARGIRAAATRRASIGLDSDTVTRATHAAVLLLEGGGSAARAELYAAWNHAGIATGAQRGVHLLGLLAQSGLLVFGPTGPQGDQRIVLVEEWIRGARRPHRDEALGELALRYFGSHGPAPAGELVRWAGITMADTRIGLAIAAKHLDRIEVDGVTHYLDPETPARLAAAGRRASAPLLLPAFDEFLLGYGDRSAQLHPAHADRIVPGDNGMFRPTVVAGGQVVGTWSRRGSAIVPEPFTSFTPAVARALPGLAARMP